MKRSILFFISIILVVIIVTNNEKHIIIKDEKLIIKSKDIISMMIETDAGSGVYEESKNSTWPQTGYTFNKELSKCENGSTLTWDDETKSVKVNSNVSDKCYVYFDVEPPLLADYIKGLYTKQGDGGLYLHDASLANEANDGSYRYAGANPNNYVCFGTEVSPCPIDNQYRIIGVFDNQVKLIKSDYATVTQLGTDGEYYYSPVGGENASYYKRQINLSSLGNYKWNSVTSSIKGMYLPPILLGISDWKISLLNKVNLNTNFINHLGNIWANKIATTTWKVGGNSGSNIYKLPAKNVYNNEIITPSTNTTYNAKIGLMYISDYGFAVDSSAWTETVENYNNAAITTTNWLYIGLDEWAISPNKTLGSTVFTLNTNGGLASQSANSSQRAIRPTFYLNSNIIYVSGSGSQNDPILIN